jgi:hypothetical protein
MNLAIGYQLLAIGLQATAGVFMPIFGYSLFVVLRTEKKTTANSQ